ncbi:MAG: membrane protein insertion efficiency factor YidD [Tissierellia bacterium]|nr:membrane protein insertion efficiency factor YidD [Tissierellia bacterium]
MARIMIVFIKIYQKISYYLLPGAHCRFRPTCSQYAASAYEKYGFIRGSFLTVRRVLKCHPFHPGGEDPLV